MMRMTKWLTALCVAGALGCAPLTATAQKISDLPAASTLTGAEMIAGAQGSGCPSHAAPCASVRITPTQLATWVNASIDAQLAALAALTPAADQCTHWTGLAAASLHNCSSYMRGLAGSADAATARTTLGVAIGSNVQAWDADLDALAATAGTNTIYYRSAANTWSPVTIGSNLTFSAGTLAATAGGSGTVTSVSVTTANGVSGAVATSTTTPAITLTLGAITPTSVVASGSVTGSNLSGTNTGDQTSVTGNAGTATTLATARTLAITGDLAWTSPSFNGSGNVTAAGTLATVNSNVGTFGGSTSIPSVTVNAKGLVTAASATTLTAATLSASWVPCKSAVAVALTGSTTETTLATCTLAANTLGANGQVEIIALFSYTNNANSKTPRFKFGALTFQSAASSSAAGQQIIGRVANRNATNAQVSFAGSGTGTGTSTSNPPVTGTVDTTASVDLVITGQLANSADTMTLESYLIRVTYGA